jgi:ribose-phosphate pyrophosphokinase
MDDEYIVISTNKEKAQATTIAKKLNITIGEINIKNVQGTETSVDIKCYVNDKKIFLIYNIAQPINESVMQLLFLCDALKKEGAEKIYLITNYLPYTKIKYKADYKLNFSLFSRLLKEVNIDKIYTFGIYSPKISFYLQTPLYNVPITNIFSKVLEDVFEHKEELIITTIDNDIQEMTKELTNKIKANFVFPIKNVKDNKISYKISENINNKDILVILDSINTGENIIEYSNYLTYKGAKNIYVIATHGVLDKKAIPLIEKSLIKEIYVTNNHFQKINKIKVVSTTKIIEEIIKRNIEKKNLKNILK